MENKKLYPPGNNVFGFPKGFLGILAGWLMGRLSVELNTWAVHHLDVQPEDQVMEIGFGPGLGISYISELAFKGLTAGMDPSPVMMRQAKRRNAAAIKSGQVELKEGAMPRIPYDDGKFDKVLSVNNIMLWPQPEASLHEVRRVLKPGGRIAITLCPRWAKTFQDVEDMAQEIIDLVNRAGFMKTTADLRRDLKPAGAITVVAYND